MLEFVGAQIGRLREFIGNRRGTRRYKIKLPLKISILDERRRRLKDQTLSGLSGHTRDLSLTGLSIIAPAIRIGSEYLTHQLRVLLVEIELPTGPIQMETTSVRYRMLTEKDSEKGHLIGVRITAMTEDHRARYSDYLLGHH